MSMVTVAMVALPITPTPAAIPPPRHVSLFEFFASTPPQTSPKSSWFSPNNGRAPFAGRPDDDRPGPPAVPAGRTRTPGAEREGPHPTEPVPELLQGHAPSTSLAFDGGL